jgi:dihydrofolate reductase
MGRISIIAAIAENGVIGVRNRLPWHLPDDLKNFRRLTSGHHILMGRRNYESIGRPLPDRTNLVLSHDAAYSAPGCRVVTSLDRALETAGADPEIFIIGGATLYAQTLACVQRLYLTRVHARVEGDTSFPVYDERNWIEIDRRDHEADARHAYAFSFITLDRTGAMDSEA